MNKNIMILAALLGVLAVILGAFAAHGLKDLISEASLRSFETGVRYQMYHSLLLLFVGGSSLIKPKSKQIIYYLTLFGIVFFSGSIYMLSTNSITNINFKSIGFITPLGGLLLIAAWITMLINFVKFNTDKSQK